MHIEVNPRGALPVRPPLTNQYAAYITCVGRASIWLIPEGKRRSSIALLAGQGQVEAGPAMRQYIPLAALFS